MGIWANHKAYENLPASPVLASATKGGALQGMACAAKFNMNACAGYQFSANDPNAAAGLSAGGNAVNASREFFEDARQQLQGALVAAKEADRSNDVGTSINSSGPMSLGSTIAGAGMVAGATLMAGPVGGAAVAAATTVIDTARFIFAAPEEHAAVVSMNSPGQGGKSEFSSPVSSGSKKDADGYKLANNEGGWNWGGETASPITRSAQPAAMPSKLTPMQLAAREITEAIGIRSLEKELAGINHHEKQSDQLEGAMKQYVNQYGLGEEMNGFEKRGFAMNDPRYNSSVSAGPALG